MKLGFGNFGIAALALGYLARGAARVQLAADNDLQKFREDPLMFDKPWPNPVKLGHKDNYNDVSVLHGDRLFLPYSIAGFCDPGSVHPHWARVHWYLAPAAAGLYLVGLFLGQKAMASREPFCLKKVLPAWNLFLAVFSLIGMVIMVPHLLMTIYLEGFEFSVCRSAIRQHGNGFLGVASLLFIYSKFLELVDTVFLVMRKKPVGFLHWYHHCTVLLYCWHAFMWQMPTGIYFISMNYSVHSIMYFYYFLAGVCKQPPRWALFVTTLQLTQMVVGIFINVAHLHIVTFKTVENCDGFLKDNMVALAMYFSYFLLFLQFLIKRFCCRRSAKKMETKKQE